MFEAEKAAGTNFERSLQSGRNDPNMPRRAPAPFTCNQPQISKDLRRFHHFVLSFNTKNYLLMTFRIPVASPLMSLLRAIGTKHAACSTQLADC